MEKYRFDDKERSFIESNCVPMAVYQFIDKRVVTLALSDGFLELYDFTDRDAARELMDNDMYRDAHPDDVARIADAALRFASSGETYSVIYRSLVRGQYHIIHALGKHVYKDTGERLAYIWYTDEGIFDNNEDGWFGRALMRSRQVNERNFSGSYDHLTGLPQMEYFFQLSDAGRDALLARGETPAILYFDFNNMKNYNIRYGFAEGDKLIQGMAGILIKYFSVDNCCRFSGDHFAVFTSSTDLEKTLEDIFREAERLNSGRSLPVRVGIYLHGYGATTTGLACDRAKMACDVNRDSVSSVYTFFDRSMLEKAEKRQYIIDSINQALREGWIHVYYQPIIRAANGKVCDEEALSRWIDPIKGVIYPEEYISILEDSRLIYKLDLYVLEHVLDKMKHQAEAGLFVVPVSVNISRVDFETCDIAEEISRRVEASGISPDKLTIEITESVLGDDLDYMRRQIDRFHELGFKVWMDDYGSGYSSPDILQSIPFDTIKLDMLFMRHFDENENSRIIISGLIKMAMGLGIETVVEGVETEAQAEFLKEVGCTKLQGFHYGKPIPPEEVFKRYETGLQIGFENPAETGYYSFVGRVNMYDISLNTSEGEQFNDYYNTMPMMITELSDNKISIIRCNKSYRKFIKNVFNVPEPVIGLNLSDNDNLAQSDLIKSIIQCANDGRQIITDDRAPNGKVLHIFIRRIAINPITQAKAVATVILAISDEASMDSGLTFANVAQALSADYIDLYYVNLEDLTYTEYVPNPKHGGIDVGIKGTDFFAASCRNAMDLVYEEDRETFVRTFTKEIVTSAVEEHGAFTLTYRLLQNGKPGYVNLKAIYIGSEKKRLIIGISNVDAQMRQQEALERLKEEKVSFSRITALAGNYICFYSVDLENDSYTAYNATSDYENLGISFAGKDFYADAAAQCVRAIYIEDIPHFRSVFNKENILESIEKTGSFSFNYRLTMDGEPRYACLKAATVTEGTKKLMIVGVSDIDDEVRRDLEYAHNLSAARSNANIDELTGMKNRHAYIDVETQLDQMISEKTNLSFSIVVMDVKGLKKVNDTQGTKAGDELLKESSRMICDIFKRSPVFRIGGDQFAVISRGKDYNRIDELMKKLHDRNMENLVSGGPVIAAGMARFESDPNINSMFRRADEAMRRNKEELKK